MFSDWSLLRPPPRNCGSETCIEVHPAVSVTRCWSSLVSTVLVALRNRKYNCIGMSLSFEGRVVLVTGAGGGKIGMQR